MGNALIGLSFGWWVPKHSAHHAHPNEINRDPDIGISGEWTARPDRHRPRWASCPEASRALRAFDAPPQHGAVRAGVQDILRRRDRATVLEGLLLAGHIAVYLTAVLWVLPLPEAAASIAVHQAVFSLYLGCSFAPNHKGMPIVDEDANLGFARRQIVTARNVTGGTCTGFVLGGLNYQIERHLSRRCPDRTWSRRRTSSERSVSKRPGYCEASPWRSLCEILRSLRVGGSVLPSPARY